MYLTKISLPLRERCVQESFKDAQVMHKLLCGLFDAKRSDVNLMYRTRINGPVVAVYMYSDEPIKKERLLPFMYFDGERNIDQVLDRISDGDIVHFDCLTAPSKKVKGEGNSKRVILRQPDERIAWLSRKFNQNECDLISANESRGNGITFIHEKPDKKDKAVVSTMVYSGAVRVGNADRFRDLIKSGIGPYKAYGCGMLLLRF